jgi:hypothetical protein
MENSDRIQVDGVWYVREEGAVPPEVKTVNWLILKLEELASCGHGECPVTMQMDYGNDWDTINRVELIGVKDDYRVEIS